MPVLLTHPEPMRKGETYRHTLAGGGGFGDPMDRDIRSLLQDVKEEKISLRHAEEAYGVVISDDGLFNVDYKATRKLRQKFRVERHGKAVV